MSPRRFLPSWVLLLSWGAWSQAQTPAQGPDQLPATNETVVTVVQPSLEPHPIDVFIGRVRERVSIEWPGKGAPVQERGGWFSADYGLGWFRNARTPQLVTSSGPGIPEGTAGVIDQPATAPLVPNSSKWNQGPTSNIRVDAGMWLPQNDRVGVNLGGFYYLNQTYSSIFSSTGAANDVSLARPFFDVAANKETASYTAFPGQLAGSIETSLKSQLWGLEVNGLLRDEPGRWFRTQYLAGVRFVNLDQEIGIRENTTPLGTASIPFAGTLSVTNPDGVRITDQFRTQNEFYGGQVGFRTSWEAGNWSLGFGAKVALGSTHQTLNLTGSSEIVRAGGQVTNATGAGFFNNTSNVGRYTRDVFSFLPEAEIKLGCRLTENLYGYVAWNFLYWNDVIVPGDHVNRFVDLTRVPTSSLFNAAATAKAPVTLTPSNFWANSIQVGLCLKF